MKREEVVVFVCCGGIYRLWRTHTPVCFIALGSARSLGAVLGFATELTFPPSSLAQSSKKKEEEEDEGGRGWR